jgi:hypothetical protein
MPRLRMHAPPDDRGGGSLRGSDGTPVPSDTLLRVMRCAVLAFAAWLIAAPAFAQRGAMTIPRNLEQLTRRASDIVRGTVVEARVEKHPELTNLNTVVVTLRVRETLKGSAAGTFTFRQYIWDIRDSYNAAGYGKGQEVLLLMIAPSSYGLSSPAGMSQGRFHIERDGSGREIAINGTGNHGLFEGVADAARHKGLALTTRQASLAAKHRRGPVDAAELAAMIRAFARSP